MLVAITIFDDGLYPPYLPTYVKASQSEAGIKRPRVITEIGWPIFTSHHSQMLPQSTRPQKSRMLS